MRIRKTSQYIEGGAGLPSYFTNEIDTGMKWIDGKPIYRKVYNGISIVQGGEKQIETFSNVDTPINVVGYLYIENGTFVPIGTYFDNDISRIGRAFFDGGSGILKVTLGNGWSTSYKIRLYFEYTKTTD